MTETKLRIDFDSEYDILFVGLDSDMPSFGRSISNGITEFLSIKDRTVTGLEVWDYKKRIQNNESFSSLIPFSSFLNSDEMHRFVMTQSKTKQDTVLTTFS